MSATPTAADLVTDPAKVTDLDATTAPAILAQLSTVTALVAARLGTLPREVPAASETSDRLLKVDEAAAIVSMSADWLYRSDAARPFRVKMGSEVRFSLRGIQRY